MGDWTSLLDELEASIADVECGGTGHAIDLVGAGERLGPMPAHLTERASGLAHRAEQLTERLGVELHRVSQEMDRMAPRRRGFAPPAPSHLDQMA